MTCPAPASSTSSPGQDRTASAISSPSTERLRIALDFYVCAT